MKSFLVFAAVLSILGTSTGCSKFFGNLRRDLDDTEPMSPPTYGGKWTEKGFLNDDIAEDGSADGYGAVGHMERSPASSALGEAGGGSRSWISDSEADSNERDRYRGQEFDENGNPIASFSSTPALAPPVKRLYRNGNRATRSDFIDESPNEGSLWASDGQTNYYFTKNKVRGIGDIVTIALDPNLVRDVNLEVKRTLSPEERETELALAQERIRRKTLGIEDPDEKAAKKDSISTTSAAPTRNVASTDNGQSKEPNVAPRVAPEEKEIPQATNADIDVSKNVDIKAGDMMMGEIVERYPNGNYKVRAVKKVIYKKGPPRLLTLVAVARGTDIGEDDVINSGKLYEYRLEANR